MSATAEAPKLSTIVDDLRALAEWLEANADLGPPDRTDYGRLTWYSWRRGEDERAELASFARRLGRADKLIGEHGIRVYRDFGPVRVSMSDGGGVCERVQVGVNRVEKQVPVTFRTEVVEEPVFETRCPDSLLRPDIVEQSKAEIRDVLGMGAA